MERTTDEIIEGLKDHRISVKAFWSVIAIDRLKDLELQASNYEYRINCLVERNTWFKSKLEE